MALGDGSRVGRPVRGQDSEGVAQPAQVVGRVGELVVEAGPVGPDGIEQVDRTSLVEERSGHSAILTFGTTPIRE